MGTIRSMSGGRGRGGTRGGDVLQAVSLLRLRAGRVEGAGRGGGREARAKPSDDDHATARGASSSWPSIAPGHISTSRPIPAILPFLGNSFSPRPLRPPDSGPWTTGSCPPSRQLCLSRPRFHFPPAPSPLHWPLSVSPPPPPLAHSLT